LENYDKRFIRMKKFRKIIESKAQKNATFEIVTNLLRTALGDVYEIIQSCPNKRIHLLDTCYRGES
jgi:hypothetical protein